MWWTMKMAISLDLLQHEAALPSALYIGLHRQFTSPGYIASLHRQFTTSSARQALWQRCSSTVAFSKVRHQAPWAIQHIDPARAEQIIIIYLIMRWITGELQLLYWRGSLRLYWCPIGLTRQILQKSTCTNRIPRLIIQGTIRELLPTRYRTKLFAICVQLYPPPNDNLYF